MNIQTHIKPHLAEWQQMIEVRKKEWESNNGKLLKFMSFTHQIPHKNKFVFAIITFEVESLNLVRIEHEGIVLNL